jgi:hypothetical protein
MSAKKTGNFDSSLSVTGRQAALELSTDTVSIHKNGIEFRSPTPFHEWAEMTVSLQSPYNEKFACTGVIVACAGNKHSGYHVSMLFTGMTPQTEKQLDAMARSRFGVS